MGAHIPLFIQLVQWQYYYNIVLPPMQGDPDTVTVSGFGGGAFFAD